MQSHRWTNPSLPQTLQIAVFLLYFECGFGLLNLTGTSYGFVGGLPIIGPHLSATMVSLLVKLVFVGLGVAAFAIANEKKWGYIAAVALTAGELALLIWGYGGPLQVLKAVPINAMFSVARVALLLHPMSRSHQRIWFK